MFSRFCSTISKFPFKSHSIFKSRNIAHKLLSVVSLPIVFGAVASINNPATAKIVPAYTVTNPVSGHYPQDQSSLGFYFTVDQPGYAVNAFGLYAQDGWSQTNDDYTVLLWSFHNYGGSAADYTQIGSPVIFKPSDIGSYAMLDQWYFQYLPSPIDLPVKIADDGDGYLITAYGNFTPAGAAYKADGTKAFVPQATYFLPPAYSETGKADFPLPLYISPMPPFLDEGFWNSNLSLVPGPMPALGAAVGYGMARRLRRRIRGSR